MILHIPAPSPSRVPLKGNNTLCGKIIGSTNGIIPLANFIHPFRTVAREQLYDVFFTKKGYLNWANIADNTYGFYKDRGYWQGYLKGYEFTICPSCIDSEEYGLMVLAEL